MQLAKLARQCVAAAASADDDDSTSASSAAQKSASQKSASQKSAAAAALDAVAEPDSPFERAVIALLGGAVGAWTCVRTCDAMVGSRALRYTSMPNPYLSERGEKQRICDEIEMRCDEMRGGEM